MSETDLLGRDLTEVERRCVELYDQTKDLLGREDLSPCVRRNLGVSLAALSQIVNDLDIRWEFLYDVGV